ncbi:YlmG homolog protein 1-2, chloroplastic [Linum grandiflorum]
MALTIASQVGVVLQAPPLNHRRISGRRFATAASLPLLRKPSLSLRTSAAHPRFRVSASASPTQAPPVEPLTSLTGATRTVTTIVALGFSLARLLASSLQKQLALMSQPVAAIGAGAGPLFFAAMDSSPSPYLNTPLTVVAAGLAKWLDIYSGVLMVRVLLSWFPNIPWDRQPLSAIRDLCDPYLSLFRNIIPPVFNTLDVSPLLAFAILGLLGSILKSSNM